MVELALVEFQYHESRGSYYQHRELFPPNPLVAGELSLVEYVDYQHREPSPPNTLLAGVMELALVEFCIASPLTFWGLLMMIHDT